MAFNFGILAGLGEASQAKQENERQDRIKQRDNLTAQWGVIAESDLLQPEMRQLAQQNLLTLATLPTSVKPSEWKRSIKGLTEIPSTITATTPAGIRESRRQGVQPTYEDVQGAQLQQPEGLNISPETWGAMQPPISIPVPAPWSDQHPYGFRKIPAYITDAQREADFRRWSAIESDVASKAAVEAGLAMIPVEVEQAVALAEALPEIPDALELRPVLASITIGGDRGPFMWDASSGTYFKTDLATGLPTPAVGEMGFYEPPTAAQVGGTLYERFIAEYGPVEGASKYYKHLQTEAQARALPIAQTQAMADLSRAILPTIDEVKAVMDTPGFAQKMGPVMGRWNEFLVGTVGTGDPDIANFRFLVSLVVTGAMRAHVGARGSTLIFEHFRDMINSRQMSAPILRGAILGLEDVLQGYTEMAPRRGFGFEAPAPGDGVELWEFDDAGNLVSVP